MKTLLSLVITLLLSVQLFAQDSIASRQWTSASGKSVTAKAHGISDGKVILEKSNGKIIKVPLNKLSKADQDLVINHFKKVKDDALEANDEDAEEEEDKEKNKGRKNFSNKFKEQKDEDGNAIYIPYELGSEEKNIDIGKKQSMNIYVPSSLRAKEKYAVMLVIDPAHGTHGHLAKFHNAADENEMIIATLPKIYTKDPLPKNKRPDVDKQRISPYLKRALRRLNKDFPIDSKRIYFCGYGEAGYIALWATSSLDGAGSLIINGGAKAQYNPSNRRAFMGLCATGSKQRWDMAATYKQCKGSSISAVDFYSGHKWPQNTKIESAIFKLNGMFLLKHGSGTHEKATKRYEDLLMDAIDGDSEDPEDLYPWIVFTEKYQLHDAKHALKLAKITAKFETSKEAKKVKKAHADTYKAFLRYFGSSWRGYVENNGRKSIVNSLTKLKEKHEDSVWASTLNELSKTAR